MIYIVPAGAINSSSLSGNGKKEYEVTYSLGQRLMDALVEKGEAVWMSRTSPYAEYSSTELSKKMDIEAPELIINIACYSDIDPAKFGFNVACSKYSAFVGTTVLAFKNCGFKPLYESGWSITGKSTGAKLQEITLYLGYISNAEDAARFSSTKFDELTTQIISLAYAPAVVLGQTTPKILNSDPYLSAYPDAVVATASTIPIRAAMGSFSDTVLIDNPALEHVWILSAMGSGLVAVTDGSNTTTVRMLSGTGAWETISGTYTGAGTINVLASPETMLTAVWVASKGVLGNLDDPVANYSILPPEYVDAFDFDPAKITQDIGGNVLTSATSLLGRASDFSGGSLKSALEGMLQKIDMVQLNPQTFVDNIDEFCAQLKGVDLKKVPVVDPNKIAIGYNKLEELLQNVNRSDKRAAIIDAANNMRNVERMMRQQLDSADTNALINEAKEASKVLIQRMENVGKQLSRK